MQHQYDSIGSAGTQEPGVYRMGTSKQKQKVKPATASGSRTSPNKIMWGLRLYQSYGESMSVQELPVQKMPTKGTLERHM